MTTPLKITALIIGLILAGFIGRFFYMVICISCTSPPIKIYKYQGSIYELDSSIKKFIISNPEVSYKFSRRDSTAKDDDRSRDLEIEIKKDSSVISYGFDCKENKDETELELTSAFGKNNTYGGYSITAPGINGLLNYFDNTFLARLKQQQHVILTPE